MILLTGGVPGLVPGGVPGLVLGGVSARTQTPPPGTRHPPPRREQQTPEYGLRAAGTHPTGMHLLSFYILDDKGGYLLPYIRVEDDPTQIVSITDIDAG